MVLERRPQGARTGKGAAGVRGPGVVVNTTGASSARGGGGVGGVGNAVGQSSRPQPLLPPPTTHLPPPPTPYPPPPTPHPLPTSPTPPTPYPPPPHPHPPSPPTSLPHPLLLYPPPRYPTAYQPLWPTSQPVGWAARGRTRVIAFGSRSPGYPRRHAASCEARLQREDQEAPASGLTACGTIEAVFPSPRSKETGCKLQDWT